MAYASSEQVQMTLSIRYDNAEIFDAAGTATLTGVVPIKQEVMQLVLALNRR